MEDGQGQTGAPIVPPPTPTEAPKKRGKWIVAIIAITLVVVGGVVAFMLAGNSGSGGSLSAADTEKLFYDTLANASGKKMVNLTYAERFYPSKEDYAAEKIGSELYSVAEYDEPTTDYRAVYTQSIASSTGVYYETVRCLGGVAYVPPKSNSSYKSLEAVQESLAQPFTDHATPGSRAERSCLASGEDRKARVTDGIIPLGLTQQQTSGWLNHLKESQSVKVEDKGTTTYNGKTVRKIALASSSLGGAGQFFTSVEKGAGLQLTPPPGSTAAADAAKFDEMATTDNIVGFYLIDEAGKLPMYSEFTAASLVNAEGGGRNNGMVLKQTYAYPTALSLDQTSKLVILE